MKRENSLLAAAAAVVVESAGKSFRVVVSAANKNFWNGCNRKVTSVL